MSSEAHSLKTLLETPRHVIPQEVSAERREQQIDRLHDLGGMSVFFDCAAEEGKQLNDQWDLNYRTSAQDATLPLTNSDQDTNAAVSILGKRFHKASLNNSF